MRITQKQLNELADLFAEKTLCERGCLHPADKKAGMCSGCEVFYTVRDYYDNLFKVENAKTISKILKIAKFNNLAITEEELQKILEQINSANGAIASLVVY